jgi:4-hydroxy-tetrahydrodipicolinate synthase
LTKGANGIVPGTGNLVPGWYVQLLVEVMNGNHVKAMQFQEKTDQISALYQKGLSLSQSITALKVMMKMQGLCSCEVLPPLQRMALADEEHFISKVQEEWKKLNL